MKTYCVITRLFLVLFDQIQRTQQISRMGCVTVPGQTQMTASWKTVPMQFPELEKAQAAYDTEILLPLPNETQVTQQEAPHSQDALQCLSPTSSLSGLFRIYMSAQNLISTSTLRITGKPFILCQCCWDIRGKQTFLSTFPKQLDDDERDVMKKMVYSYAFNPLT